MTTHSLLALIGTLLVLAVVPGPSDIAVVARAASAGFRHGALMTLGIIAADIFFIVVAILSLRVAAEALGTLFELVRYGSAAYLLWLGLTLMRQPATSEARESSVPASQSGSVLAGFTLTLGDPKAILFYLGLFPAFVDLPTITLRDAVIIMLVATGVVGGVKLGYAWLAGRARAFFDDPVGRRRLDRIAGALLLVIAVVVLINP